MHMADALLSPAVGGAMCAAAAGTIACCSSQVKRGVDDRKVPLMGVLGAFLFAAQMINFTIPATGSSGHLGGGLLLAVLLGPHAALLVLASVLMIQALFFADGGLLALGCNIINLGVFPAFVAYPLVYRPLAGRDPGPARTTAASLAAAVTGLQLGAGAVVLETSLSGIAALPIGPFAGVMLPIHLGIGIVEGLVTAVILSFVRTARPDIFAENGATAPGFWKSLVPVFLVLALLIGGLVSRFASDRPDGLEWSLEKVTGTEELAPGHTGIHGVLDRVQGTLSFLPAYSFRTSGNDGRGGDRPGGAVAGVVGAFLSLGAALLAGGALRRWHRLAARRPHSHEHAHPHRHCHDHPHRHGELEHSHRHDHEHSHPHPHVHDHCQPHPADPNPFHSHDAGLAEHDHDHGDGAHGSHEHQH